MDEISALFGLDVADDEKQRMLADSLRGRKRAADFFAATTVPQIAQMAQQEQANVLDSAKQAGVLRRALEDRRSRERVAERDTGVGRYMNVQPVRLADGTIVMMGLNPKTNQFEIVPGLPEGARPDPMTEGQMQRAVAKMPDAVKPLFELTHAIDRGDKLLAPFTVGGEKERPYGDIPGAGIFSGKPGMTGWMARRAEQFGGDDPAEVYGAIRNVQNYLIREQSGLTQSIMEIARQEEVFGQEFLEDPEAFLNHLGWLKDLLTNRLDQVIAAQSRPVQQEYRYFLQRDPFEWNPRDLEFPESGGMVSDIMGSGGERERENYNGLTASEERRRQELLAKQKESQQGTGGIK